MFGYIKPQKSELLMREYEQYKGIYCGLCRQLKRSYGFFSTLTLSYDCTFLAMILFGLSEEKVSFEKARCVMNPLKKCVFCTGEESMLFSSAVSVIMTYYKIRDDIEDSKFSKKLRSYILSIFMSRAHKKAAKDFPDLEEKIAECMQEQKEAEKSEDISLDACAEPTAKMLAFVFQKLSKKEDEKKVLEHFGYFLGRWIYFIDAADDLEKDIKTDNFNPLIDKFQMSKESSLKQILEVKQYSNEILNANLAQVVSGLNLLSFSRFQSIILNIIENGLPEIQREYLFQIKEEKNDRSI